ncbi:hypothetical protein SELR_13100 [Selenomonas ruminantium subsp. lactilytica TAM6421]|uniref:Uncharacterized protein n=2 Tax=Selenomonas ruminantium TaxID=971 RepID=I0GQI1_SELRL|nr:hypothetical protein SELR_13100 [Selenomonas ruminantium subsp. lactilytica TAM6421]
MSLNLDVMIRTKLGEAYAMSPWTEDKLDEMLQLIEDYAEQRYKEGYQEAIVDAQSVAQNVSFGIEGINHQ